MRRIFNIIIYIIYISLIIWQSYNFFAVGRYMWVTKASAANNMIVELLLVSVILFLINIAIDKPIKYVMSALLLLFMGYVHQAFFPIIVSFIYFCTIIIAGYFFADFMLRGLNIKKTVYIIICLSTGIGIEIIIVSLLSLLKIYSVRHTWYALLIICFLCLLLRKNKLIDFGKLIASELKSRNADIYSKLLCAYVEICLFIQFARVGLQCDYDSLWYGLRSSTVLARSPLGIYEDIKLVGFTYLYPKGIEIVLLPLGKFHSWDYQYLFNVWISLVIAAIAWLLVRELTDKNIACIITAVVISIPSLMNMAVTVKPDVITVLFQLLAVYLSYMAYKKNNSDYIYIVFGCLIISYCFKITTLLFTTSIIIALIPFIPYKYMKVSIKNVALVIFSLIVLLCVWGRTFYLTGSPLIVYVGSIIRALGIKVKYPYAINDGLYGSPAMNGSVLNKLFNNLYGYFVLPTGEGFEHTIIAWGTSIPVILLLIALLIFAVSKDKKVKGSWVWFVTVMLISMLTGMLFVGQTDGNYFLIFYIIFIIVGGSYILCHEREYTLFMYISVIFNLFFSSVSNWSSVIGFTDIKILNSGYIDQDLNNEAYLNKVMGKKVYSKVDKKDNKVLVFTWDMLKVVSLKCTAELWIDLENGNNKLIESMDGLYEYLTTCGFNYILVDVTGYEPNRSEVIYINNLIQMGAVKNIRYGKNCALLTLNDSLCDGDYDDMSNNMIRFINKVNGIE